MHVSQYRPDGRLVDKFQVHFLVVLVFDCLHGGLDRCETVLEARKSTWMASQGRVLLKSPHITTGPASRLKVQKAGHVYDYPWLRAVVRVDWSW